MLMRGKTLLVTIVFSIFAIFIGAMLGIARSRGTLSLLPPPQEDPQSAIDKPIPDNQQKLPLTVGETNSALGLTLTLLEITEDSRCPADVQCIQAGRLESRVKVEAGKTSTDLTVATDNSPVVFSDYFIALVSVEPMAHSEKSPAPADYRLTYIVIRQEQSSAKIRTDENVLAVLDQKPGSGATISAVNLMEPGFIAIYEEISGETPVLRMVGLTSRLEPGAQGSLRIPTRFPLVADPMHHYYAELHPADQEDAESPDIDIQLKNNAGEPVGVKFEVREDAAPVSEVAL
jgi:hypothetical protein